MRATTLNSGLICLQLWGEGNHAPARRASGFSVRASPVCESKLDAADLVGQVVLLSSAIPPRDSVATPSPHGPATEVAPLLRPAIVFHGGDVLPGNRPIQQTHVAPGGPDLGRRGATR